MAIKIICMANIYQIRRNKHCLTAVKKRVGEKNPFFGKTHSEKTKMEIGNANSIHLTSELEDEIVNLYKIYGIFKIAKVLNIGKKKVNNVLKKRHVVMRPPCINRRKKL